MKETSLRDIRSAKAINISCMKSHDLDIAFGSKNIEILLYSKGVNGYNGILFVDLNLGLYYKYHGHQIPKNFVEKRFIK